MFIFHTWQQITLFCRVKCYSFVCFWRLWGMVEMKFIMDTMKRVSMQVTVKTSFWTCLEKLGRWSVGALICWVSTGMLVLTIHYSLSAKLFSSRLHTHLIYVKTLWRFSEFSCKNMDGGSHCGVRKEWMLAVCAWVWIKAISVVLNIKKC